MADKAPEPIEVRCPICGRTAIVYIPIEQIPHCPDHDVEMVISELLHEGKST